MCKKFFLSLLFVAVLFSFSGCAIHNGLTSNLNQKITEVVLSKNNYKIITKVQGSASGHSVLGIGGSFSPLIAKAKIKMLANAGLEGTSRAVINEIVEVNNKSYVGIVTTKTVTVSAYIIEFTE